MSTAEFNRSATLVGRPPDSREMQLVGRFSSDLLPTQTMLGDMPRSGEAMNMFYAQSWLMVHYMFSTPERQRAFSAYMRALNTGADPVEAFEAAFAMSADEFKNALSEYMRGTIQYWNFPNRELEASTVTITRMPRSADNLLLLNARMMRTRDENAELIDGIVAEASRFPGDAYATRSAAYAELSRDPARARELATPLIEADPQDFEAQYIVGRSYYVEAEAAEDGGEASFAQARRHFVRAFRVNPNHVPTLYYYVLSQREYVLSDEVLDVLVQAHLLAPQVDEIRFNLAIYLLNARRFQDAAMLLGPIAYNPHGGETATRARRYLEAARRNAMPEW
jgi:tetratricopeptide (TPR) repeat protein